MTTKQLCWRDWDGCLDGWHNWGVINGDGCGIKEYGISHYLHKQNGSTGDFLFVNNELYPLNLDPPIFHAEARMHSAQTDARGTWGFMVQDVGSMAGGLALKRISDTETDLYFMASDPSDYCYYDKWTLYQSLEPHGIDSKQWHTYSYDIQRYTDTWLSDCSGNHEGEYVTYGKYLNIKVDGETIGMTPSTDYRVSDFNGGDLLYTYILSNDQLSNYGWGLDNLCTNAIFNRNSYDCFPKWKQTQYGMRPTY